jgi:hypothetical protein
MQPACPGQATRLGRMTQRRNDSGATFRRLADASRIDGRSAHAVPLELASKTG